jgi:DNA-binding NtrC family response regulator
MPDILIIDDEKAIRKTLSEILSFEGYKIEEACDGEEGLKKFKEKSYDVVLCDIKMPKLDGIEFLQKAGENNSDIPIIMISGHGNIETAHYPQCDGKKQPGYRDQSAEKESIQGAGNGGSVSPDHKNQRHY